MLPLNLRHSTFNPHMVLSFTGILSGQSKPSLREVRKATLPHCWNELWWDSQTKINITTTLAMLTSGSNLYVQYFNFCFCYFDNKCSTNNFCHTCVSSGRKLPRALGNLQVHASAGNRSDTDILLHCLVWGIWESGQLSQSRPGLPRRIQEECWAAW